MSAVIDPSHEEALRLLMEPMGKDEPWGPRRIWLQLRHYGGRTVLYCSTACANLNEQWLLLASIVAVCLGAGIMAHAEEQRLAPGSQSKFSQHRTSADVLPPQLRPVPVAYQRGATDPAAVRTAKARRAAQARKARARKAWLVKKRRAALRKRWLARKARLRRQRAAARQRTRTRSSVTRQAVTRRGATKSPGRKNPPESGKAKKPTVVKVGGIKVLVR